MNHETALQVRTPSCPNAVSAGLRTLLRRLAALSHNSLALLGLGVLCAALALGSHPGWQDRLETGLLGLLQVRQVARQEAAVPTPAPSEAEDALNRVTAANPGDLSTPQAAVAQSIARRYRVSLEPIGRLVQEAWSLGERLSLDPTLILAVAAVESGFNPFAQGAQGSQGIMQVRTHEHDAKFLPFGGTRAAFDPISNLRVGVLVLKECIERAGTLESGLRLYAAGADTAAAAGTEPGYAARVLSEQTQLQRVSLPRGTPRAAAGSPAQQVAAAGLAERPPVH